MTDDDLTDADVLIAISEKMFGPVPSHPPTEKQQLAYTLRTEQNLTWREIAERLGGIRPETARQYAAAAWRKLRELK